MQIDLGFKSKAWCQIEFYYSANRPEGKYKKSRSVDKLEADISSVVPINVIDKEAGKN